MKKRYQPLVYTGFAMLIFLISMQTSWAQFSVGNPQGALDYADCNGVGGWAFDRANLNQTITVDIYIDGVKTYSGIQANGDRQDLVTAFGSTAARYHGFSFSFPTNAPWKNGQNHSVSVRICGATSELGASPKTVSGCSGGTTTNPTTNNPGTTNTNPTNPQGYLDQANCNGVSGWAFDQANLNQPVTIDIYVDGVKTYSGITANGDRQDLVGAFGSAAARYHGYSYSFPATASWKNGQSHTISVRISGANGDLGASPKTVSGCSGGSQPSTSSGNCPYTEGQPLFTTSWGESVYAHFYNGVLYAGYKDGSNFRPQHWLTATGLMTQSVANCFAENDPHTSTTTTNPPTTTNPANPSGTSPQAGTNFAGNLDWADCQNISGWVANRNTPNKSTKFDVYINGWLVAIGIPATQSRQDVANVLGISGYNAFGFYMPLPRRYKTGSAMTISVKYSGTQTDIPGSPKTTAACPVETNPLGCSNDGSGRIAQTESSTYSRTGGTSLRLSEGGGKRVSSLTSKLIPVNEGDKFSLDAYAYAPGASKPNLAPQLTSAIAGGILAGAMLSQQQTTKPDQSGRIDRTLPVLGVSTALLVPLAKSLLTNRLPNARIELAFYDQHGQFVHRQQVGITKNVRFNWELLHIESYAPQSGYVAVRLQNASKAPVWFDDISLQRVQLPLPISSSKQLFIPKITRSAGDFSTQQPINTESLYRNCNQQEDPLDRGWLNVDVTVRGQGNDNSISWGWISGPESGSITGPGSSGSTGGGSSSSSNTATFVPYNAPKDSVATGLSTTGVLTKGQVYYSPTGATYIWDGKSWCIPINEVEVKGQRPTNPNNGQFYFFTDPAFGYTTVYEYISGHWTMPMIDFDINSLPKPKFLSEPLCKTLKRIWSQSFDINGDPLIENMLLVTDKGILVLPTSGRDCSGTYHSNKVNESWPNYFGEYITIDDGNGNKSTALDLCDGTRVIVYSAVHTHPSTAIGNPLQPSPGDINFARNNQGVSTYILANDGLWNYDTNGHLNLNETMSQLNNCK